MNLPSKIRNRFGAARKGGSGASETVRSQAGTDGAQRRPAGGGGNLVSAREIRLSGQWGQVFGPLDLDIDRGGVTLISAPPGSARTALMMALCGRMKLHRGKLTVLGHTNDQESVFRESAIACFDELDEPKPSITVQDLITEQIRWESNFFKWVPLATTQELTEMCGYLFEGLPLPPIDAFISDLTELEQSLIRIGVANTRRPPLLVVGRVDRIADGEQQDELLDRLVVLGGQQSVLAAHANAEEFADRVSSVVEVPGLYEFEQRRSTARKIKDEEARLKAADGAGGGAEEDPGDLADDVPSAVADHRDQPARGGRREERS